MLNKSDIQNLDFLASNEYWGRGIMIGNSGDRIAIAYFIMGRSENSRNRYFYMDGENIAIAPYDIDKLEDPSLIIYYPIKQCRKSLIVTNGNQTDTIEEYLLENGTFEEALRTREFEPDAPNYTPRISGIVNLSDEKYTMSILKNIDGKGVLCGRNFFEYEPIPGVARFIHTYERNDNPLPTFEGEPWRVAVPDDIDTWTSEIWSNLNDENKISLCTMFINPATHEREVRILNKRKGD